MALWLITLKKEKVATCMTLGKLNSWTNYSNWHCTILVFLKDNETVGDLGEFSEGALST